jgi:hypothetical protein
MVLSIEDAARKYWMKSRHLMSYGIHIELDDKDIDYHYIKDGRELEIYFEKSRTWKDWKVDGDFIPVKYHGRIYHRGFLGVALEAFEDLSARYVFEDLDEILIIGHSLGAAVSSILCDLLRDYGYTAKIDHATFGELSNAKGPDLKEKRCNSRRYSQGIDFFVICFNLIYKHYGIDFHMINKGSLKKNHNFNWMEKE